ncbi:hypothetical protein PPYR_11653 [Photinus pyralis]|uniref:CRAL-TRIO domain-containing protein n=1 Tax=Photinus pyralis TaxID=7054 RepID=A0A1Y1KS55_PHOPY|nr:retinol-binding protein pinta-like [Photinus pyralis]XP_031352084.1 retinol-binding protein pinta-like [Photinus pyralis]KAB0794538.1 hypothetical protein PPYR_11377 [Photinus pyralis]KAB0794814.1 hypothetical protein PPYR_11653 [Photinus pyralis]
MAIFVYSNEIVKHYAEKFLNETEENYNAIIEIRQWLDTLPHLNAKKDDKSILCFLRGCKFNLELTKKKMKNFYVMKGERTEWFVDRNPLLPEISELVRMGVFVPLRKFSDNKMVVIIRTATHDPKVHKQDDVFKAGKMVLDVAIQEYYENATVFGICAIFDMTNISLAHAKQLPPSMIKKAVFAWQNYYSRPKQLEFINAPTYINVILSVFKSFMSAKLQGRVRAHYSGLESLHKVVSKDILPVEYGGSESTMDELIQYWHQKVLQYSDWFKEDEKYRAQVEK